MHHKSVSVDNEISPKYLILYIFKGTMKRAGIGHASLWDGLYYYSYGYEKKNGACALKPSSCDLQGADKLAYYQAANYGACSRIILPANKYLSEHFHPIREHIHTWKTVEYDVSNKNCVHLVQAYLEKAGYLKKITDWIIPLYPSELADKTRNIGKTVVKQLLEEATVKKQFKETTLAEKAKYLSYLKELKIALGSEKEPGINQLKKNIFNCESSLNAQSHFFCILKILAHAHYNNKQPKEFSAIWFSKALEACPITPNFIYQPKGFFANHPHLPALGRGALGILGLIALTTLALVCASVAIGASLSAFAIGTVLCLAATPFILVTFLLFPEKYFKKEKNILSTTSQQDNFGSTAKTRKLLSISKSKAILDEDIEECDFTYEKSKSYTPVSPELSFENLSTRIIQNDGHIRVTM